MRMNLRNAILVVIGLTAFAAGCSDERVIVEKPPSILVGTVTDDQSGDFLGTVTVSARLEADTTANPLTVDTTDASGQFKLVAGYYSGRMYVLAEKDGFLSQVLKTNLIKHETVVVNFELEGEE